MLLMCVAPLQVSVEAPNTPDMLEGLRGAMEPGEQLMIQDLIGVVQNPLPNLLFHAIRWPFGPCSSATFPSPEPRDH